MSSQEEHNVLPKPIYIRGFPFVDSPRFDPKKIEDSLDYVPEDGDIILSSYPKTGTTWAQYIIWAILHKGEALPSLHEIGSKYFPFMEISGIEPIVNLTPPRTYKNHFPYHLMKINKNAKYIYIHRNPMDTLISYYHFRIHTYKREFEMDVFFERFISGEIEYGDYFDHVLSFDSHKDESHLLILSYEDLHKDKGKEVLRLAKFLGDQYYQALMQDEDFLQRILDVTTFNHMKENVDTTLILEGDKGPKQNIPKFRKGIVGEGNNVLSAEQKERLYQRMLTKMKGTNYVKLWSP